MAGSAWTNQVQNQVIVAGTNGGVYIYSGTPAKGNPPVYWITNGGLKDPFGNVLIAIQGSIANIGGTWQAFSTANGFLQWWYSTTGSSGPWTNGASIIQGNSVNGDLALDSNPGGGVSNVTELYLGNSIAKLWLPAALGNLNGVQFTPGTGLTALNTGTVETWHAMTLLNSWANVAGYATARYRLTALNQVEVIGAINAAAATSATFFTLPAGYIPASQQPVSAMGANASVPAGLSPWVRCDTSGNLTVQNTGALGAWQGFFHGFVSLDA